MIRLTVLCFVTFAFVRFYVAVVVIAVVPVVVSAVVLLAWPLAIHLPTHWVIVAFSR
jgi:hypothetical protein